MGYIFLAIMLFLALVSAGCVGAYMGYKSKDWFFYAVAVIFFVSSLPIAKMLLGLFE